MVCEDVEGWFNSFLGSLMVVWDDEGGLWWVLFVGGGENGEDGN